ncbi:2Fe-2S iron-sulfur cluster-binding protein [Cohnella thermotolerans]|jgi:2Fe-2S ferredoxin|uniref:2Fe-2S iron-sulfur cluster-binding protein n=1 Tax=Cohnella thermotolerans TaxID=329858 RepID=UPI000412AADD|nr:2Fe-2S iron-sulfur cluster-binding protein [Cohnella thermotolerans]
MADGKPIRVRFLPDDRTAVVRRGTTLLEASRKAKAPVRTRCGGVAGCLMCKVTVEPGQAGALSEPTPAELLKLGPLLNDGVRLSCQARVQGDVDVRIPEDPLKAAVRRRLAEQADDDLW